MSSSDTIYYSEAHLISSTVSFSPSSHPSMTLSICLQVTQKPRQPLPGCPCGRKAPINSTGRGMTGSARADGSGTSVYLEWETCPSSRIDQNCLQINSLRSLSRKPMTVWRRTYAIGLWLGTAPGVLIRAIMKTSLL